MKYLIINADDFGLNHNVNAGIFKAWKLKAITQATLMIKRAASREAVHFALENPGLTVGLHIDLDEVLECKKNMPHRFSVARLSALLKTPGKLQQVIDEIEEQIALFKKAGLPLMHIDGHHHLHALPALFPSIVEMMIKFGIRTVRVSRCYDLVKYPAIAWDENYYVKMKSLLKKNNLSVADHFEAILNSKTPASLSHGVTELMTHPGEGEDWRKSELGLITSEEWSTQLGKNKITLISYNDVT
ncbi:MAG: ChbG/HpnK family deacetylase [Proteobacteria bacterium]|nr:ChbG/HpnK family deacetylase [Pseudomonadota bacterium]